MSIEMFHHFTLLLSLSTACHSCFTSLKMFRDCMHNSAQPHIARQVTALLRTHFGDEHVISWGFSNCIASLFSGLKSLWLLVVRIFLRPCLQRKHTDCSGIERKHTTPCIFNWSRSTSCTCWTHYNTFWTCDWSELDTHWTNIWLNKVLRFQFVLLTPFFTWWPRFELILFIAYIVSPWSI